MGSWLLFKTINVSLLWFSRSMYDAEWQAYSVRDNEFGQRRQYSVPSSTGHPRKVMWAPHVGHERYPCRAFSGRLWEGKRCCTQSVGSALLLPGEKSRWPFKKALHNYSFIQPEKKHIECPNSSLWITLLEKSKIKGQSLQVFPFSFLPSGKTKSK